jgi:hypothetical protein
MAFHAIMVVRDEGDIIAQTIAHTLNWCDSLGILDTGSTDDTWDIVNDFASRDPRVRAIAREPVFFHNGVRAVLFDRVRHHFKSGDWIARLDADEHFHIPPPAFIAQHVRYPESRIRTTMFEFVLTDSHVADWTSGRESLADRARPIEDRRRIYYIDHHPEVRLFKYRRTMKWPCDLVGPLSEGLTAYERIPVRHYRCRDLAQVQRRCAVRSIMTQHAPKAGTHWPIQDWRYWIWRDNDPRLRSWEPGTDLPTFPSQRAARGAPRHITRQLYYGSGAVYLADLLRPRGQLPPAALRPIPPDLQAALAGATSTAVQ